MALTLESTEFEKHKYPKVVVFEINHAQTIEYECENIIDGAKRMLTEQGAELLLKNRYLLIKVIDEFDNV